VQTEQERPTLARIRPHAARIGRWLPRYDFSGLVVGILFFCWSLTPSLLPRSWLLQGFVSGILVAAGYGVGVLIGHVVGRFVTYRLTPTHRRTAWRILLIVGGLAAIVFLRLGVHWQQEVHVLLEVAEPPTFSYLGTAALAGALFVVLVQLARSLRWLNRKMATWLDRWIPQRVAQVIAAVLAGAMVVGLLDGIVFAAFFDAADGISRTVDAAIAEDVSPPDTSTRSGSPASLVSWEGLGSKGRDFVAGGPTTAELEAFNGRSAAEPVRVYVGLEAAETEHDRAAVTVAELERAGGFDQAVLCVIVPTGTGWISPTAAAALEYLHNGDTALVSMQYGYLPSWLSYLVDPARAREAGRELFNQVYDQWSDLPEDERPLLLVYGESLGSHGSEAAFSGDADLRNRTDGALWVGPPNFNTLWREFTTRRDRGTLERLPTFDGGQTVRFAASASDLYDTSDWPHPRVVYLQHASDPVVWWSPNLLLRQPDWLREPYGDDVLGTVRWFPLVTFAQLTVDLLNGYSFDADGYGHRYESRVVDAWVVIAPSEGWKAADTERLKRVLSAEREASGR